jgi:hypothetical protein
MQTLSRLLGVLIIGKSVSDFCLERFSNGVVTTLAGEKKKAVV